MQQSYYINTIINCCFFAALLGCHTHTPYACVPQFGGTWNMHGYIFSAVVPFNGIRNKVFVGKKAIKYCTRSSVFSVHASLITSMLRRHSKCGETTRAWFEDRHGAVGNRIQSSVVDLDIWDLNEYESSTSSMCWRSEIWTLNSDCHGMRLIFASLNLVSSSTTFRQITKYFQILSKTTQILPNRNVPQNRLW